MNYTIEEKLKIFMDEYLPSFIDSVYEEVVYGTEEERFHKYYHEFGLMFVNVGGSMIRPKITFDKYLWLRGGIDYGFK